MRVAIIGLGLIGGSFGLALKRSFNNKYEISGYSRRTQTLEKAGQLGAIDSAAPSLEEAVKGAGLVFVATPVLAMRDVFAAISPHLQPGCIVTDAGSTKEQVMNWAGELLPSSVSFIGGHPMAGKEISGIEFAEPGLFHNCIYCLVYGAGTDPAAVDLLTAIVQGIGARSLPIAPDIHDLYVGGISHLPFLISVALTAVTSSHRQWPQMSELASTGYADMTRLSAGSPEMYRDICLSNSRSIAYWLGLYIQELKGLKKSIEKEDVGIGAVFEKVRTARDNWWQDRK